MSLQHIILDWISFLGTRWLRPPSSESLCCPPETTTWATCQYKIKRIYLYNAPAEVNQKTRTKYTFKNHLRITTIPIFLHISFWICMYVYIHLYEAACGFFKIGEIGHHVSALENP